MVKEVCKRFVQNIELEAIHNSERGLNCIMVIKTSALLEEKGVKSI